MRIDLSKPWAGMAPITMVRRNPDQPRKMFPQGEIEALAGSMKQEEQVTPCAVMPAPGCASEPDAKGFSEVSAWMLVDGEMRWRAAQVAGKGEVFLCYKPGVTAENLHVISFAANFCRTPHTKRETALAIAKERERGRSFEEIGAIVGKSGPWAFTHHQLLGLHPDLLRFVDEADPFTGRKLAMKNALLFVGQPHERQLAVYRRFRCQSSSEQYHAIRRTAVVKSERAPSDDFAYVSGLMGTARARVKTAGNVGEVMLKRFTADQLDDLQSQVDEITKGLGAFSERLQQHMGRAG
jgi:ParB family chromosome partitioning protein